MDRCRDLCRLTGKYRGQAHNKCITNNTQKQSNFILFLIHNFSNFDCQMLIKMLIAKAMIK